MTSLPKKSSKHAPKSNFDVYLSEGNVYFRKRRYVSAIKAYNMVEYQIANNVKIGSSIETR